jgi:hypothetical protein
MLSVNRALPIVALLAALAAGCGPKKDTCTSPHIKCGDKCVDGSSDPANCGACGEVCGAGQTCCGACVDLQTNKYDCGACRHSCIGPGVADADASCSAGVCQCTGPTATGCGGTCVNTAVDRAHCGDCATACTFVGSQCQGGACGCFDPDPIECTSAASSHPACTNLFDPQNCGTCGVSCTLQGKTACPGGQCACTSGSLTDCGALGCFDLQTDEAHCGGCVASACTAGQLCCGASCKSVATDNSNCGTCGNVCTAPATCQSGSCACPPATPKACGTNCCIGTTCCGSGSSATCQTAHGNGLGNDFFDCTASYPTPASTTRDAAVLAAKAWGASAPFDATFCLGTCVAGLKGASCAVWCWGDPATSPLSGRVGTDTSSGLGCSALACPNLTTSPTWPAAP